MTPPVLSAMCNDRLSSAIGAGGSEPRKGAARLRAGAPYSFRRSDVRQASVSGLEGTLYIDKTYGFKRKQLGSEAVRIAKASAGKLQRWQCSRRILFQTHDKHAVPFNEQK